MAKLLPAGGPVPALRATPSAPASLRRATVRFSLAYYRSWDLLAPHERAALAQLSVFQGGFSLDAAEAVLNLSAQSP